MSIKILTGFISEEAINSRNEMIAIMHGCHGDKTLYWFAIGKHPAREEWAFVVPEGEEYNLDTEEQARLISLAEAQSQGWFPPLIL